MKKSILASIKVIYTDKTKVVIWLAILLGILSLIIIIFFTISQTREDVRDQLSSEGFGALFFTSVIWIDEHEVEYFDSMEEAMRIYFGSEAVDEFIETIKNEIIRIEEDCYLLLISAVSDRNFFRNHYYIYLALFRTNGNRISPPLYAWFQGIDQFLAGPRARFYDEDRVARDIIWSYAAEHVTVRVNDGVPIYYGTGIGPPPAQISILGYEPDVILPFTYNGNEYFFWYYLDAAHFGEVFAEHFVEFKDGEVEISWLTMGAVIEVFDIQVVR